ncbi:fatty-acid amide hydrolase 2-like [Uloborus diversus]|uniref:fatty-acid amide hydrolase 2-like n=1 Tax=Uloborus diversus TaxID=327109 RepID=UPI00240996B0|nr:fatty-acid amide hydrolase 2-like [Uloborus diversus]XP_054718114.1 fatty-acid amide hydrolase 2-like [Uloborus diversus]
MGTKKLFWKFFSIIHRLFDIVLHYMFKIANFGKPDPLPPIKNLLLLSPAVSLAAKIRKKKLKSVDLVKAFISRVLEVNPFINAVVAYRFDKALEEAEKIDELIASNYKTEEELERETPFLGVPMSVKELIAVEGMPLSAGLVTRKNTKSPFNAQTVQLMKAAGAIPFVTTNVSELGMWYESYNRVYGRTSNPYDINRIPGGSSGGEGSIVAAAGSVIGIGSDIGGSIRIPAFFNGVFGHKPTSEVVSNYGTYPPSGERELVPYLCMGPLCRYATDLNPMMRVLAGKNASLLRLEFPVVMKELKIYYIEDVGNHVMFSKVEADMVKAIHKVLHHFENAYKITPRKLELPALKSMYLIWASSISNCKAPTFSDELAERKGHIGFKTEFLQWLIGQSRFTFPAIALGLVESSALEQSDYFLNKGQDLRKELEEILGDDGILLFPSHPTCAPHHNEPLFKPFNFMYTGIFNIMKFPVTQCPLGLGSENLPIGVQVVANAYNDRLTMAVAVELEKAFGGWVPPCAVE